MRRQPIHAEITGLDVNLRRRSAIGYTAGLALYALVVVALYPAFKHTNSLDTFIQKRQDCRRAVRFGITGTLSSSTRWLNGNPYANFFPLIALLLTIGYRAAAIAGQDEDGTLCLIALPVRRSSIVLEKGAPMALEALVLGAMVAICVIVGRSFQLDTAVSHAITTSLAVLLMALDFGPITMAIGALTGSRATALGIGATLAAASYLSSARSPGRLLHPPRTLCIAVLLIGRQSADRQRAKRRRRRRPIAVTLAALAATTVAFRRQHLH